MIYDTGEYNVTLDIPSNNFVIHKFFHHHTENMEKYLSMVSSSIQDSNTLIIFNGVFQNLQDFDHWVRPMNEFCANHPNPVLVLNGNLTPNTIKEVPQFHYHRFSMFDHVSNVYMRDWVHDDWLDYQFSLDSDFLYNVERPHKFYWASSKDWYPRRYILAGLFRSNLVKDNLVNYKCTYSNIPSDWMDRRFASGEFNADSIELIKKECYNINHLVPLPPLDDTIEFNQTKPEFFHSAYLGIITDTFYERGVFLSEKIFNAMNFYQMFFYVGPVRTLQYLRERGYQTFDDVIDTSYDNIENNGLRLIAARNSLLAFLNQPIQKIREDYRKCIPQLMHNKRLLQQQRPDTKITEVITNILNEH